MQCPRGLLQHGGGIVSSSVRVSDSGLEMGVLEQHVLLEHVARHVRAIVRKDASSVSRLHPRALILVNKVHPYLPLLVLPQPVKMTPPHYRRPPRIAPDTRKQHRARLERCHVAAARILLHGYVRVPKGLYNISSIRLIPHSFFSIYHRML